ncbi:hypothetical protein FRC17_009661 [Serendipita sp. 399]|nr:hypothetical protein FRC17_009661 [Serendipita sp. 399]
MQAQAAPHIDLHIRVFVRDLRTLMNVSSRKLRPHLLRLVHERAKQQMKDCVPRQRQIHTRPTLIDEVDYNPEDEDAGDDHLARNYFRILFEYDQRWTVDFLNKSPWVCFALLGASVLDDEAKQRMMRRLDERSQVEVSEQALEGDDAIVLGHLVTGGTVGAVTAAAFAPSAVLATMSAVGFTTSGIAAGSLAAAWQSAIGNVAAGSIFAGLQSMGAVGALAGPLTAGIVALPLVGFAVYKLATLPTPEERLIKMLGDVKWVGKFWEVTEL